MVGARVAEHVARFNGAVVSGDWRTFVEGFTDHAVMSFVGVPVPPMVGRDAILAGYRANPPADTLTVLDTAVEDEEDVVRFAWDHGGTGSMRLRWSGELVSALVVAFEA